MRRLNTKFDTNGSRAIIVPKRFAADIAGKYGPARGRAKEGRASLIYRTSMVGKKKPLGDKPATIVRVQVVMPQPAPIVKVQETRVLRERVIVKDSVVTKPTVHREREREKPVVQERIVEREKPIVRERVVEREKPIIRERVVEREKPVVRERIAEREKQENPIQARETTLVKSQQRNTIARNGQTDTSDSRDPIRSAMPILGRTIVNRAERKEIINKLFQQPSTARELAFRLLEEEAGRSHLTTVEMAKAAEPMQNTEAAPYTDSVGIWTSRNVNMANRGSREPIRIKKLRSPDVRQVVSVISRDGASRQWNAVVLIDRRTMDRMKTLSASKAAPILMKQAIVSENKADRAQQSLSVQNTIQGKQPLSDQSRDTQALQRELNLGQAVSSQPDAKSGNVENVAAGAPELARPSDTRLARTNGTARDTGPADKLAIDKRLLGVDSSTELFSVTMSEALPSDKGFPIVLRTIDHLGLTVRLMAARAERLGATFVLRNRVEPGATAETGIPSFSKLILRRLTPDPNTFITAKRTAGGATASDTGKAAIGGQLTERVGEQPKPAPEGASTTTINSKSMHEQPAAHISSNESTASKPIERERSVDGSLAKLTTVNGPLGSKSLFNDKAEGEPGSSAVPPTLDGLGILRMSGRVKARLDAPNVVAASAPRALPTGMIVHATRRGLSVLGRMASRVDVGAEGTATRQANGAQPKTVQPNASQLNVIRPDFIQPNTIPNASQPNAMQSNTEHQNVTRQNTVHPSVFGPNLGSSVEAENASANGTLPSERTQHTDLVMKQPSETSKLGFEEGAPHVSDRSTERAHLARLEPTMSDGLGHTPRVRFTFRNRPNGSFTQNKTEPVVRDIQSSPTASNRISSTSTPLASRVVPETNRLDTAPRIGNADDRQVNLHWIARTSRPMTVARKSSFVPHRTGTQVNRTAADRVQTAHTTQQAQTTQPTLTTRSMLSTRTMHPMETRMMTLPTHPSQLTQPMLPMQTTQSMQPMTHQLLSGSESFLDAQGQPEEKPLFMAPSLAHTALRRTRQQEARQTSGKPNLAAAPAAMELRRNAAQPVKASTEPAPAAVTVEAPPQIDAKQLQKAIEAMPQLNPDQLAERVYTALMKKMKFERRLRGY